jgi:plasmid stability protein
MSAIQVKNVPVELHERLRTRARLEGRNLSDYVLDVLRRDLRVPSTQEWLERLQRDEPVGTIFSQDISDAIHEARAERYEQIVGRAVTDRD